MSSPLRVFTFKEWIALRGISPSTGWRLIRAGKITVTQLSEHRIGVREDHDREYLERGRLELGSCLRGPPPPRKKPKPAPAVTSPSPEVA